MKLKDSLYAGSVIVKAALLNKRVPLAVSYLITNRCNYSCAYCGRWKKSEPELATDQVLYMMRELGRLGTRFLQITGGEPFLREDLIAVVRAAGHQGFFVGINTNGALMGQNLEVLHYIDSVTFSLDGPAEVHEQVRPQGSFATAINAIDMARSRGVSVQINTTLTRHNTGCIDYLVDLAREKGAVISFQPASPGVLSGTGDNPVAGEREAIVEGLQRLEELQRRVSNIKNSKLVLKYMKMWPFQQGLVCAGGRIFYRVASGGDVRVCGRYRLPPGESYPNILSHGVETALKMVQDPSCSTCYNVTRLRINLLYDLLTLHWGVFT